MPFRLFSCAHLFMYGARLLVNPSWKNPSQEWHVGCKLVYELFTDTLTSPVQVLFMFNIDLFCICQYTGLYFCINVNCRI